MGEMPAGRSADDGDAGYRRALRHKDEFVGLTERQAVDLASQLELDVEFIPAGGWHMGVNVSGRVKVFVRDGLVVATTT